MLYSSVCIFFVTLTILSLFAEHLIGLQRDFLALPFFAACLISLVVSMYYSIRDITVSLAALELGSERPDARGVGRAAVRSSTLKENR